MSETEGNFKLFDATYSYLLRRIYEYLNILGGCENIRRQVK